MQHQHSSSLPIALQQARSLQDLFRGTTTAGRPGNRCCSDLAMRSQELTSKHLPLWSPPTPACRGPGSNSWESFPPHSRGAIKHCQLSRVAQLLELGFLQGAEPSPAAKGQPFTSHLPPCSPPKHTLSGPHTFHRTIFSSPALGSPSCVLRVDGDKMVRASCQALQHENYRRRLLTVLA